MIPNPIAYIPQFASGLTSNMVTPERLPLKHATDMAHLYNILQKLP